jgi:ATP-dependent Lon protease
MLLHELKRRAVLAPDDAAVRAELGEALLAEGQTEAAVRELEKAAALAPNRADVKRTLARAYRHEKRQAAAFRALQEAVQLAPGDPAVRDDLAELLLEEGRLDDALVHLEEAVRAAPRDAARQLRAADVAMRRRLYLRAQEHVVAARSAGARGGELDRIEDVLAVELGIEGLGKSPSPLARGREFLLGRARAAVDQHELRGLLARPALRRVVEELRSGEVAAAKRALVLAADADDAGAAWLRGEILLIEGDRARARAAFGRVAARSPKTAPAHARIAELAMDEGDLDAAAAALRVLCDLAPTDADALELSGDVARAQGRAAEATRHYAAALDARPTPALSVKLAAARAAGGRREEKVGAAILALGWNAFGGVTSRVEAVAIAGKGELVLTGNVGKTGQEAARVAHACLKARATALGIEAASLSRDLHLHYVDTEFEKDGPSAGVALALAGYAALSGRALHPSLAASGEITLHGAVRSVGGLHEKLVAAYLAGVARVILPRKNLLDVRALPQEVLGRLTLFYVDSLTEALDHALDGGPGRE